MFTKSLSFSCKKIKISFINLVITKGVMSERNINLQQLHASHYFCSIELAVDWLAKNIN